MLSHLLAVLGLAALCGAWILFQRWLARVDPDGRKLEAGCGGCSEQCSKRETARGCRTITSPGPESRQDDPTGPD